MTLALASLSAAASTTFSAAIVFSLTFSLRNVSDGCRDHVGEAAELVDQLFRDRLGVHARDRHEQQKLEQLIIRKRIAPAVQEAFAQSLAMAKIMRKVFAPRFGQLRCRAARASPSARG